MMHRVFYLNVLIVLIASCAQSPAKKNPIIEPLARELETIKAPQRKMASHFSGGLVLSSKTKILDQKIEIMGTVLEHTDFDIPIIINSNVIKWVDYFTGRGRKLFTVYLQRSEYFIPFIKESLNHYGMPEDLVYLAMIESGFNNKVRSRARAVGAWQFIPATGKRYGLKVNWWVDERRDVKKSTQAAIRYLRDLYNVFHSWELATAAYNAGEYKISRAIQRFGTMNYWTITRQQFLRPETRNYVPKLMAAAIVAKNRKQFGFKENDVNQRKSKEELESQAKSLELQQAMLQVNSDQELVEILDVYDSDYLSEGRLTPAKYIASDADSKNPVPHLDHKGKIGGETLVEIEIQSPADLQKIAKAAGLDYRTVKKYNPEILRWCTPPMVDRYRIKIPKRAKTKFLTQYNHPAYPREIRFRKYKVRRGDTLKRIARRFGIRVTPLQNLNGLSKNPRLKRGEYLLLPMPSDRTRSIRSLDLRDPPRRRRYRKRRKVRRANVSMSKQRLIARRKNSKK